MFLIGIFLDKHTHTILSSTSIRIGVNLPQGFDSHRNSAVKLYKFIATQLITFIQRQAGEHSRLLAHPRVRSLPAPLQVLLGVPQQLHHLPVLVLQVYKLSGELVLGLLELQGLKIS